MGHHKTAHFRAGIEPPESPELNARIEEILADAKKGSSVNEMLCKECGHSINKHHMAGYGWAQGCHVLVDESLGCDCEQTPQDIAAAALTEARREEKNRTDKLVDYINSVLSWLDNFGAHAPIVFGNEAELWQRGYDLLHPKAEPATDVAPRQHDLDGDDYRDLKRTQEDARL